MTYVIMGEPHLGALGAEMSVLAGNFLKHARTSSAVPFPHPTLFTGGAPYFEYSSSKLRYSVYVVAYPNPPKLLCAIAPAKRPNAGDDPSRARTEPASAD